MELVSHGSSVLEFKVFFFDRSVCPVAFLVKGVLGNLLLSKEQSYQQSMHGLVFVFVFSSPRPTDPPFNHLGHVKQKTKDVLIRNP